MSWHSEATTTSSSAPARSARAAVWHACTSWFTANPLVTGSSSRSIARKRSATFGQSAIDSSAMWVQWSFVDSSIRANVGRPDFVVGPCIVVSAITAPPWSLVEQVGLLLDDPLVHRLEREPAGDVGTRLTVDLPRRVVVDDDRRPRRLRHQRDLAAPLHPHEPPRGLVHRLADGQQPVVPQDRALRLTERRRDVVALL